MFDPYYKWLGIPPKDQPPHHYRLLGLDLYEKDLDVIEGAADRVMGFVRQYQSGEHAELASKLLNEVATVRLCLLKPASKSEYDEKLKREIAAHEATKDDTPSFVNDAELAKLVRASKPAVKPASKPAPKKKKPKANSFPIDYLLAGIATIVILLPAIVFFSPNWGPTSRRSGVNLTNPNPMMPRPPASVPTAKPREVGTNQSR